MFRELYKRGKEFVEDTSIFLERHVDNVTTLPNRLGYVKHRARHGWAVEDNWSLDYALSRQLVEQFADFEKHFDPERSEYTVIKPMSAFDANPDAWEEDEALQQQDIEEWLTVLRTIRKGFHNYLLFEENGYSLSYDSWKEAHDAAMAGVQESFRLMGKYYSSLWW